MNPKLRALFDHTAEFCATTFRAKHEVMPMFVGLTEGGEILILPVLEMSSPEQKEILSAQVRAVFKLRNVTEMVFVTEGWMVAGVREATDAARRGGSLQHHPDRIEVISIVAEDKSGSVHGHFQILRPEHGAPTLAPLVVHDPALGAEGRMFGFLR